MADLVEKKHGIQLSLTSVGRLLAELQITPEEPLRRACERDPKAVQRWQKTEYPALRRSAQRRGADIFFLYEAGIRSDACLRRMRAPRGQTPVVPATGRRQSVNPISAVNARGAFWYATYTGRFNARLFITFLKAFLRRRHKPVFLVVGDHPSHRAKVVSRFVQEMRGKLELHFLPG